MNLSKNQLIETEIIDVNMMGMGVAKYDHAVIFVQYGVTGDRALIRIIKCLKKFYVARIEKLLVPSKFRTDSPCPHFKKCGGCSFQHLSYSLEKEIKEQYLRSCLRKEGLSDISVLPILSTEKIEGYRNKAQFPIAEQNGEVVFGFYAAHSHSVCPVERCLIQDSSFAPIIEFVCGFLTKHSIKPYCEETHSGLVRHIYLRRAQKCDEIMLCLVLKEDRFAYEREFILEIQSRFPKIKSILFNINPERTNVILGKQCRLLFGKDKINDKLCEREFVISPLSFYQVNRDAAELLYQTAFQIAKLEEHDLILDLYCGIGSISISATDSIPIVGVEIVEEAVFDAKTNAKMNGLTNANFICGDAADAFRLIQTYDSKNPLLIVDPPRKGLSSDLIRMIAEKNLRDVLYISCGPDTLARDLKLFCQLGYQIGNLQPVDLFPRTGHVESVVCLKRQIQQ